MHVLELLDPAASMAVTALVNGLWQGLVLIGLVWGLLRIVEARRRLNATTRYAVWSVALVGVLCLPVGAAMMAASQPETAPVYDTSVIVLPEATPAPVVVLETPADAAVEASIAIEPVEVSLASVDETQSGGQAFLPASRHLVLPWSMEGWMPFVFGAWLLVALALVARVARGCVYVRRLKRRSIPLPPSYQQRLDAWCRAYGLRRAVKIAGVETLATPVAAGLRHPMILVPVSLLDHLTDEEFDQVMLHELAHLARRDDWTNLFHKLAQAVLFFHPAVYYVGRQMEREREMACDDWVVSMTRRPRSYASCLARLVELDVRSRAVLVAPGMAVGKEHLFERVRRLLDQGRHVTAHLSRPGFLTVVLALAAAFLLMTRVALFFAPPEPVEAVVVASELSDPVIVLEPNVAVISEPQRESAIEPVVVVDVQTRVVPAIQVAVELGVEPLTETAMTSVEADTIVSYRPIREIRLNRLQSTVAINQSRQTMQATQPRLRQVRPSPQDLSVVSWVRVLKAAGRIGSSGDRARFLTNATRRMPANEEVYAAYLETAGTLGSSGDRSRVLSTMLKQHRLSKASMLLFLDVVQGLTSSGDRARLLLQTARVMPNDDAVHEAYLKAAESLSSSSDYRRVLSALTKEQR